MAKIYYKVVNNKLQSACASTWIDSYRGRFNTQYILGEWVKPKVIGSQFMVFEDFQSAKRFRDEFCCRKSYYIYKCIVKTPRKSGAFASVIWDIDKILKLKKQKKKYTHLISEYIKPPTGTIFCSAIKLIERV